MKTLIVVLFFTSICSAQVTVQYDKFKDQTVVSSDEIQIETNKSFILTHLICVYPGKKIIPTRYYLLTTSLFHADTEPLDLYVLLNDTLPTKIVPETQTETFASFILPKPALENLIDFKGNCRLGSAEFTIVPEVKEQFKQFIAFIDSASSH